MPRFSIKSLMSMKPEDISKLSEKDMTRLLEKSRNKLFPRLKSIGKEYAKNDWFASPAYETMMEYYNKAGTEMPKTRNKAMAEIFKIQEFFNAKSSTIKGTKEFLKEQDAQLFGVKSKQVFGKLMYTPKYRLDRAERTEFWSLYREYTKTYPTEVFTRGSATIQQSLAEMIVSGDNTDSDKATFLSKLREKMIALRDMQRAGDDVNYGKNVYTGHGIRK